MSPMAAIRYERGYDIDRLLNQVCDALRADGLQLGGLLQVTSGERGGNCLASVHVIDLLSGTAYNVWDDHGKDAQACRLSEAGLADAESVLQTAVEQSVDLLIINRFGRAESTGRGLRRSFEQAVIADIPVLTAVREPYDVEWSAFHGGLGAELPCDDTAIVKWARAAAAAQTADT